MRAWLAAIVVAVCVPPAVIAASHNGHVVFGGVPVPGATVTATHGDRRSVTATDPDGAYRLDLSDGTWTIRIEMIGFAPVAKEIEITGEAAPITWELTLLPFEEITRGLRPAVPEAANGQPPPTPGLTTTTAPATPTGPQTGFQ